MADFNLPTNSTSAVGVLDQIKAQIVSVMKMFIGTSDTNVPDGAVRYNPTDKKFQEKAGASWNDLNFHQAITDAIAAVSSGASVPTGTVLWDAGSSAPTGYLLCDGTSYSTVTYAALFARIGYTYGGSGGSFNVPNCKSRFLLGKNTTGSFQTLGQTGGSLDHTHSVAAHQHTLPTHSHDITHTHTAPAHSHSVPAHTHLVPAHYHSVSSSGADIEILATGGSHQHVIDARSGAAAGSNNALMRASAAGADDVNTVNDATSAHAHAHNDFAGRVGYVTGGNNGDSSFFTIAGGSDASLATPSGGSTTTTNQSSAYSPVTNSGPSGTLTTNSGEGSGTSGANNPAYIILNCIIKT